MKESQENNETKKQEKNKSENINIISQEDMINIKNINSDLNNELFGNNNNPNPQNKKNNFDQNESNVLNYNYLDSERINSEEEDIYNKSNINNFTNNKSLEEIINKLKEENKELKNDMKRLYFLTEENKNNLMEHIQILKSENYK